MGRKAEVKVLHEKFKNVVMQAVDGGVLTALYDGVPLPLVSRWLRDLLYTQMAQASTTVSVLYRRSGLLSTKGERNGATTVEKTETQGEDAEAKCS